MSKSGGSTTLLPEPFEVRRGADEKPAPAARAAAERRSQVYKRRPAGPAGAVEPDPSDETPTA